VGMVGFLSFLALTVMASSLASQLSQVF